MLVAENICYMLCNLFVFDIILEWLLLIKILYHILLLKSSSFTKQFYYSKVKKNLVFLGFPFIKIYGIKRI